MDNKEKAVKLRENGKTCGEIVAILGTPKSTIWSWIKNANLSDKIKKEILKRSKEKCRKNIIDYNKKVRPVEAKKIRDNWTEESKKEIKKISQNDLRLIGSALYWAEGNTKNRNRLQFSNSDPLVLKVAIKFFREICKVKDKSICARAHIYPGINYKKILNFWSITLKLSKKRFYPPQTQISRASKGRMPRNTLPYGTLHLTVLSTELSSRVKGWIQGISENI
jgi:hypothetical protein